MDLSFPPLVECCFVGVVDTTCALCVLRVLCQQSEPQAAKSATTNKDKKTGGGEGRSVDAGEGEKVKRGARKTQQE